MEVRNNNGGLRLMVKAVIVGKTTVNNKIAWRVCASNDDMQNVGITDVDSKSLLEIMNQLGISDDYNIEVIDESSGNMKIKPKDLKNIHSISDLSKPEFKYVLLGFIRQKKIARVLNVETNIVHSAEFIFVPRIRSMKLKVRIGGNKTESVYCDNLWLLPNGRFDDKHYLYNTHGTGESLDLPQTYCEIIGDEAKDFNTRYYGLTPVQEIDASETDKEAEITGDDKVESCNAPMEIPDEPDKSLNETAETNQNRNIYGNSTIKKRRRNAAVGLWSLSGVSFRVRTVRNGCHQRGLPDDRHGAGVWQRAECGQCYPQVWRAPRRIVHCDQGVDIQCRV